jgi:hypothetical protein
MTDDQRDAERQKLGLSWSNYRMMEREGRLPRQKAARRGAKAAAEARVTTHDQDGYGWNCDADGNFVGGKRIAGSSPDDAV